MHLVVAGVLNQGSVSLATNKMIATVVTQELGLVLEGLQITPTRVETVQTPHIHQIMEGRTSKPWDTSWFSDILKELNSTSFFFIFRKGL